MRKKKKCPVCKNRFIPATNWQKYCGPNCKQIAWNRKHRDGKVPRKTRKSPVTVDPKKIPGLSEQDIRLRHDVMFKIRQTCKKLIRGRYFPDQQMREFCLISPAVWKSYSDQPDFEKYRMKLPGMVYWGHPASIHKMREELNAT